MLRLLSLVPVCFFLAACVGTPKDVIRCGKNNYVASGSPDHPFGNHNKSSQRVALLRANKFCDSKDKKVLILNIVEGFPTHVAFRCVDEDDPALEQSEYRHIPIPDVQVKSLCQP